MSLKYEPASEPQVDLDRSGALDFSEFLCMLFLWATVGTYTHIFESQNNSNVRSPPKSRQRCTTGGHSTTSCS